jgi:cbb3-type cytochrome oxidase maturation protein
VAPIAIALEWMLFALAGLMGLAAWLVYVWAVRDGQFKDVENAAEKVLKQELRD